MTANTAPDAEALEPLILVDENDTEIAEGAKFETHRSGALHRAFSVFLFNGAGEILLQQRAPVKYHSRGKWANTCCGHPRPGEDLAAAARRRLGEELGLDCELHYGFPARYRAELDNGMIENEIAHLFFGRAVGQARPDCAEVSATRFVPLGTIARDIDAGTDDYAAWLIHYVTHHCGEISRWRDRLRVPA